MSEEISLFLTGTALGATAGLSPGPLQTLVLGETLRYSVRQGLRASLAPLLSDPPIVLLTVAVLDRLTIFDRLMGGVSICGALFLAYLSLQNLRGAVDGQSADSAPPTSLRKAVITNLLNPHPYIFWSFVGAPTILTAHRDGISGGWPLVAGFYLVLIGTFTLLALGADTSRRWIRGRSYRWVMRLLAGVLLVFAGALLYRGCRMLICGQ